MTERHNDLPDAPKNVVAGAMLPDDEFAKLFVFRGKDKYAYPSRGMPVAIEGFPPGEAHCSWSTEIEAADTLQVNQFNIHVSLGEDDDVAAFTFVRDETDTGEQWNLWHREVLSRFEGRGLGSFAIRTAENFVRQMHAAFTHLPTVIATTTSRPTIMGLMRSTKYAYASPADETTCERYVAEWRRDRGTSAFKEHGELPSFILAKYYRGADLQGELLLDRAKAEAAARKGSEYASLLTKQEGRWVLQVGDRKLPELPFVIRVGFRKDCGTVGD